jgi:glucose/arabinose dehydrogenase
MAGSSGRGLRAAGFAALLTALAVSFGGGSAAAQGGSLQLMRIGDFEAPVYVEDAPGAPNLVFVVEQPGAIRVVRHGKTLSRDFLDIRDRVLYGGEQGLLSVAFDPAYESNRRFYVYYVNHAGNIEVDGFRASKGNDTRAKASSRQKIIVIPHPVNENHNGGQLQFGPDGYLYLATGDGGSGGDPDGNAQNKHVLLGKLLRIDPRKKGGYKVPKSNPFRGGGGAGEIYALGLRNPYRFSFDQETGDIFIGDVGQEDWEEVDREGQDALRGANFGWDIFEGDHDYEGGGAPAHYEPPVLEYSSGSGTSNCAITGGYVVRDFHLPSLAGIYVYADFCGGEIRGFDPSDPEGTDRSLGLDVGQPSSFGEGPFGRIYVTSLDGAVYRLVEK